MRITNRQNDIYEAAFQLFLEKGYIGVTMRDIAEKTGVSLGLVSYYSKTKKQLAVELVLGHFLYLERYLIKYIGIDSDPFLYSATLMRLMYVVFNSEKYRKFYLECLKEDILFEAIEKSGIEMEKKRAKSLNLNVSDDYLMLYGNLMPTSFEKVLVLSKEAGKLPSIAMEEIPELVFRSSVERFITDKEKIDDISKKAKAIVSSILEQDANLFNISFADLF